MPIKSPKRMQLFLDIYICRHRDFMFDMHPIKLSAITMGYREMSYSKGVDYFGFINNNGLPGAATIAFSGPKVGGTVTAADSFAHNNLQVDSSNISGLTNFTGPFTFAVSINGAEIGNQTSLINSFTGNLEGGTMTVMLDTPPIVDAQTNSVTAFGFYDAGAGGSGLTNQDQSWVYCTRAMARWMTDMVAAHPSIADQPFRKFVLPGAHDAGMCTMDTVNRILSGPEGVVLQAAIAIALPTVAAAIALGLAPTIIMNAAMTQKDTVANMLALGCRYFDFRPGTMYPAILGVPGRYHQHSVIPGMAYVDFLASLQTWLAQNPGEIVVVSCNTQGFESSPMNPSAADLVADWNSAIAISKASIGYTDQAALGQTYAELLSANTRVVFLNQIDGETTKYDSYTDAYAALTPGPIIAALGAMNTAGQADATYTVLQLQGTASGAISANGFLSSSQTASPLMSTKALFDSQTLPWVMQHGAANLQADKLVVLLNDFIENATADVAIGWTLQRMGVTAAG